MDDANKLQELAAAERHVALCEKNVANQRAIIAELERDGHDTTGAQEVLRGQEEMRRLYAKDRDRVLKELGHAPEAAPSTR
jgi:DNA-binding transcriptional MocR family regulator